MSGREEMMLPAERIMSVFEGGHPDKMPWMADLSYWYNANAYFGTLPERYRGKRSIKPGTPLRIRLPMARYGIGGRLQLYKDLGCVAHEELYSPVHRVK